MSEGVDDVISHDIDQLSGNVKDVENLEFDSMDETLEKKEQEIRVSQERFDELFRMLSDIKRRGVISKQEVIALETFEPGIITKRMPLNSFTVEPSKVNYQMSIEQIEVSMENAGIVAGIISIILIIIGSILSMMGSKSKSEKHAVTIRMLDNYTSSIRERTEKLRRLNRIWDTLDRLPKDKLAKLYEKINAAVPEMIHSEVMKDKIKHDIYGQYALVSFFHHMEKYIIEDTLFVVMNNRHRIIKDIIKDATPYHDIIKLANNFDILVGYQDKATKILEQVKHSQDEKAKADAITHIDGLCHELNNHYGYTVDGVKSISNMVDTLEPAFKTPINSYVEYFDRNTVLDVIKIEKSPMTIIEKKNLTSKLEAMMGLFKNDEKDGERLVWLTPVYAAVSRLFKELGMAAKLIKATDEEIMTYNSALLHLKKTQILNQIRLYEMALEFIPSDSDRSDFKGVISDLRKEL